MNIKPAYQVHELCYALNIVGEMKVLVEPNKFFNHNLLNILVDEFDSSPDKSKSGQQTRTTNNEKVFSCLVPSLKRVIVLDEGKAYSISDVMSWNLDRVILSLVSQTHNVASSSRTSQYSIHFGDDGQY
ncbi:Acyl-CoA synthetase family member [Daphnia magna]|uniref:Acyl-CoA synthetase family member n=1 Tax=Daphnia magna TaxID=35525 RepID=A0A162C767_9CRUS|nr:Acyl-CoA synthetase family member [Daphnia magna]